MSKAIATIQLIRGESFSYGLRSTTPSYDGTETITSDIKAALNGNVVPAEAAAIIIASTATFVAEAGAIAAHWLFSLTPAQTATMTPGSYITDAKVVYASGVVDYPKPLAIEVLARVTA